MRRIIIAMLALWPILAHAQVINNPPSILRPFTATGNNATAAVGPITGTVINTIGADAATSRIGVDSFGTGTSTAFSTVNLRRANGTAAAPSAIQSGDLLFGYVGTGYGATQYLVGGGAGLLGWASQTYTNSVGGAELSLVTTPNGTAANTEAIRLLNNGQVKFTAAANFSANGSVATTMTSLGPTGSHTTVQKWLTIIDNTGAVGYIPVY